MKDQGIRVRRGKPTLFSLSNRLSKAMAACLPLVIQINCACLLIQTCCNTTKCGLQQERGTTTSVQHLQTSCVLQVASSPISSAPSKSLKLRNKVATWQIVMKQAECFVLMQRHGSHQILKRCWLRITKTLNCITWGRVRSPELIVATTPHSPFLLKLQRALLAS